MCIIPGLAPYKEGDLDRDQLSPQAVWLTVGVAFLFTAVIALTLGFWVIFSFDDALGLISSQVINPEVRSKSLSWENWQTIAGIVIIQFWVGVLVNGLLSLARKRRPKLSTQAWQGLLKQPYHKAAYHMLGVVCAETLVFAWLPYSLLYHVYPRQEFLVFLIAVSSFLFALRHIRNFSRDQRNYAYLSVQMILGVMLSLVYLEYGFRGALLTHAVYDVIPFTFQWFGFRVKDSGLFD